MRKHRFLITSFAGCLLLFIFVVGGRVHGYRIPGSDLLSSIGFQDASSSAQDPTSSLSAASTSTPTLTDVLRQLQDHVASLSNQMLDFRSELEIVKLKTLFARTLRRGDSGNDVTKLQEMLAKIAETSDVETALSTTTTGYYGHATEIAVRQFQEGEELKQTGVFDTNTRERLFRRISDHLAQEGAPTEFVPIDLSSVPGLPTMQDLQNKTLPQTSDSLTKADAPEAPISTSPDTSSQISPLASRVSSIETSVADLQNQVSQLASNLSNAQENPTALAPAAAPTPTPTPAPAPSPAPTSTPPKLFIANIQAMNITRASSTIGWFTNTPSSSEVDYSTNSAVPANQMALVSTTALTTAHRMVLQGLSVNTKYYYRVVSKDATGIVASSTVQFFNTSP